MLLGKTKRQLYLLAFVCCHLVSTMNALVEFKEAAAFNGVIDSEMVKITQDGRDPNTTSVFELMRLKIEERHGVESRTVDEHAYMATAKHGEDIDI